MRRLSPAAVEVAPGVYRLGTRWANFYLVADDDDALLVDAGYPGYRHHVDRALESLGMAAPARPSW